jgi:hypothetical protein
LSGRGICLREVGVEPAVVMTMTFGAGVSFGTVQRKLRSDFVTRSAGEMMIPLRGWKEGVPPTDIWSLVRS